MLLFVVTNGHVDLDENYRARYTPEAPRPLKGSGSKGEG
jgi:hypothetical protein